MTANHRPLEESDIELIDRVRAAPCLYDTRNPNFRLVYKKEQEWQSIADSMAMSHWEARKRWTVLRDRYARELKQLILHPDSMEYGKNDFFHRMDFIRNFVKKREVKRKRCRSRSIDKIKEEKPLPLKLYKVDCDVSNYESDENQVSQEERKSYIIDDCQYVPNAKFSYVQQTSQDSIEQEENAGKNHEQCGRQDYHERVEGSPMPYDAVEDHESFTQDGSNSYILESLARSSSNIIIKPEITNVSDSITSIEDEKMPALPQLHHKSMITDFCTSTSLQIDTEEYFSKTIALYLRQLSPRHKIKAKIEMMQIIEKFLDLEQNNS